MKREEILREPIRHLDLGKVKGLGDLLEAFHYTSFQSRSLASCLDVYTNMMRDKKRVTVFMGLSGAMVPAGMRKVIVDLMERGFIDVLVSTGANLYHDYAEAHGPSHFVGSPHADDTVLLEHSIDRIFDTFADERKFKKLDAKVSRIADSLEHRAYSTREFLAIMGSQVKDKNSILGRASKLGIPVFCPAINDSSIGIGLSEYYARKRKGERAVIDVIRDVYEIAQIKEKSKKTGVVYIGGGTPKNYIQQISIVLEVLSTNADNREGGHDYAIQITTDDPKWGGLSGCTFEEAQSWGKIARDATKSTCYIDATIGLPLLAGALMERVKKRKPLRMRWKGDELKGMG